jgi:EpsI family protein
MRKISINKEMLSSAWPLFAGIILLSVIFHSSVASIFDIWLHGSGMYSHGILLLIVSFYILVREWWDRKERLNIKFRFIYGLLILFLSFAWLLSEMTYLQTASQLFYISILAVFVLGLYGFNGATTLLYPILLLLCAIPVWAVLERPLQVPTATLVNNLLHFTGYVSIREGYVITIPEGSFEVGNRCSGLRYQIAAITIAFIYTYFARLRVVPSIICVLSAILTAFLSNVIRIYIVVLSGHYTNMTHSLLHDHIWLGWVVFFFSFVSLFYFWNKYSTPFTHDSTTQYIKEKPTQAGIAKKTVVTGVLVALAAIGPLLNYAYNSATDRKIKTEDNIKLSLNNWESEQYDNGLWKPSWINADSESFQSFTNAVHTRFDMYIAYYAKQGQGKEVINSRNRIYDEKKWKRLELNTKEIEIDKDRILPIKEEVIQNSDGDIRLVWAWYYIGGNVAADALKAKIITLPAILSGRSDATAIVVTTEGGDLERAKQNMKNFIVSALSEIEKQIDKYSYNL